MSIEIKPGLYITKATLQKIGLEGYENFRKAVRAYGYRASDTYGDYDGHHIQSNVIALDIDGDLVWTHTDALGLCAYKLTLDQVKDIIDESQGTEEVKIISAKELKKLRDDRLKNLLSEIERQILDANKQLKTSLVLDFRSFGQTISKEAVSAFVDTLSKQGYTLTLYTDKEQMTICWS